MSSAKIDKTILKAIAIATSPPANSAKEIAQNEHILNEILLRLPIKSLMRFKLVSKPWLAHITSPNFVRGQAAFHNQSICGLIVKRQSKKVPRGIPEFDFFNLYRDESSPDSTRAPFGQRLTFTKGPKSSIGILQSSDGLLLCTKVYKKSYFHSPALPRECYIYNPATKQYFILPQTTYSTKAIGFSLAFDLSKSPYYKVVCVYNDSIRDPDKHHIAIYSSETQHWRLSTYGPFRLEHGSVTFDGGVYWNGAIHWISMNGVLLYFKLDEEKIREISMAPESKDTTSPQCGQRRFRYFGVSGGHLHLIDHIDNPNSPWFDVYEMATDYTGWFTKFRVDLSGFPTAFPQVIQVEGQNQLVFCVLSVVQCEPEEDSYMVLQIPGEIVQYKFKTGVYTKIDGAAKPESEINWYSVLVFLPAMGVWPNDVFQYIETLTPVA